MSSQDISIFIAACSALFSAISAGVNLWNTNTFRRQLKNTTIDACVAASGALKAAVHKTIELKANEVDKITSEETRGAYGDAWTKWVAFYQAFRIAQRLAHQFVMIDSIKKLFQIEIDHPFRGLAPYIAALEPRHDAPTDAVGTHSCIGRTWDSIAFAGPA